MRKRHVSRKGERRKRYPVIDMAGGGAGGSDSPETVMIFKPRRVSPPLADFMVEPQGSHRCTEKVSVL